LLRFLYNIRAVISLKRANKKGMSTKDYYQAGMSVEGISEILSVAEIYQKILSQNGEKSNI